MRAWALLFTVRAWQNRPLEPLVPIVYFDALVVKSREDGRVPNKAVYVALGITLAGEKTILGLWIGETEGAKFWLGVFTELKNRGMQDCFIACVDGLKGLPEAVETVFPQAQVQLCIVHKVRNSLNFVPWKERKTVARDLRAIYAAPTLSEAETALEAFAERWDAKYPAISPSISAASIAVIWCKISENLHQIPTRGNPLVGTKVLSDGRGMRTLSAVGRYSQEWCMRS